MSVSYISQIVQLDNGIPEGGFVSLKTDVKDIGG